MCGIFAYLNYNCSKTRLEIISILINGLKRLEYRGYDSAGVALDGDELNDQGNRIIKIIKQRGRVDELNSRILSNKTLDLNRIFTEHFGIAHTRWATHGEPNEINSHPQSSGMNNEFVVIHNGIITNYKYLQKLLLSHGKKQVSMTDTELIVLLMQHYFECQRDNRKLSFLELTNMVLQMLEGAYALVLKSSHFPNEVIATRKSSPLIVGMKFNETSPQFHMPIITHQTAFETNEPMLNQEVALKAPDYIFDPSKGAEYFFASDTCAIVEHTNKIIYLEDGDIVRVKGGYAHIYRHQPNDQSNSVLLKEPEILMMEMQQIMKGNFDSFMEKEIFEQPDSLTNTMRGRVNFDNKTIKIGGLERHIKDIQRCRRIIFVSCGTSYNSCLAVRQTMEELTDLPIMIELASDLLDRRMPIFRDDVCVFVSQSGETADTLNALRYCKEVGALVMGITNVVGSSICRETDCGINLNAGPEIGVASTKAYTSQIIALTLFACLLGSDKLSKKTRIIEIIDNLKMLPELVTQCLKLSDQIKKIAKQHYQSTSCLIVGRGNHAATCVEGALKVKEISYIHSEGIQSGELKHGPLALVDEKKLIIVIVTKCRIFEKSNIALQQVLSRKAKPILITDCDDNLGVDSDDVIKIPHIIDSLQAIPAIIPLQLLALNLAKLLNLDVDFPRNLAKSVTVD